MRRARRTPARYWPSCWGCRRKTCCSYAVVVHVPGGMLAHRFCGMPRDGIMLHAAAVQSLAWGQVDMEASKLAAGCTACGDEAAGK